MISIRRALADEMEWVNARYKEVDFVPSYFEKEMIAIAEFEGEKAGLGRLVRIDSNNLELGGMYVFDSFRNRGVAKKLVEFLLGRVKAGETVFCIPFAHLLAFYTSFGFRPADTKIPKEVQDKYQFCKGHYKTETALLVLTKQG